MSGLEKIVTEKTSDAGIFSGILKKNRHKSFYLAVDVSPKVPGLWKTGPANSFSSVVYDFSFRSLELLERCEIF